MYLSNIISFKYKFCEPHLTLLYKYKLHTKLLIIIFIYFRYGLYNYRMINTLHKVHSKVIAEAITVLYNCNDAYDINDMRILRIGNLVRSDEKKFEPNICILKSLGWWDERVTPEQFQMLLHECNYRLFVLYWLVQCTCVVFF